MLVETELIVLSAVRYSDNASIVTTYSERLGTIAFKAIRSASRKRGRANALFTPLSVVKMAMEYHPTRAIQIPGEPFVVHAPLRPSLDSVANAVALFTVELLTRVVRSSSADTALYRYLRDEIVGLEHLSDKGVSSFHLRLMVGMLHYMGILPDQEQYREGFILDLAEGAFRRAWTQEEQLLGRSSALLVQFITTEYPEELSLSRHERNALLDMLLAYLAYHFPDVGTLRSPEVLSQLF